MAASILQPDLKMEEIPVKEGSDGLTAVDLPGEAVRPKRWRWLKRKEVAAAPESMEAAPVTPEARASFLSQMTFSWMTDLMILGARRPLEATDLYRMEQAREAANLSRKLEESWQKRLLAAEEYNTRLEKGLVEPPRSKKLRWIFMTSSQKEKARKKFQSMKNEPSLIWALNDVCGLRFWSAGLFRMIADTLQTTSPLLMRELVNFLDESYYHQRLGRQPPSVGKGIGLAIGLFAMQLVATVCTNQFFYRGSSSGVLFRAALLVSLYERAVSLTNRARSNLTNAKLTAHMSTDISRIDFACSFFHSIWASPLQLSICLALLLVNLGPSALAGFAVFLMFFPLQNRATRYLFDVRQKCVLWTDKRTTLVSEIVNGIRIIKPFCLEKPYLRKLDDVRKTELRYVRRILIARAANVSIAFSLPAISAVVAFIVYKATGHDLNAGILFSSLSLFQLLRQPLMMLPQALNAATDAKASFIRLQSAFQAERLTSVKKIEPECKYGILVLNASFVWDSAPPQKDQKLKKTKNAKTLPTTAETPKVVEPPFEMHEISLKATRGQLTCISGAIGSGKSSLCEGLIGDMRKTAGSVTFGGQISYAPQIPFCMNGTIRENITFGLPFQHDVYWQCIQDACLSHDLGILTDGDLTEIGERGVSLSGGQKQRVSLCRVFYRALISNADVVLLDDCFSALDAHVTTHIFEHAIQGSLKGKTILLVTHALHLLSKAQYIYVCHKGRIEEEGTYDQLVGKGGNFAELIKGYGSQTAQAEPEKAKVEDAIATEKETQKSPVKASKIMQQEERAIGRVGWPVWQGYFQHGNGKVYLPVLLVACILMQGAQLLTSYWLVFWQERTFDQPQGFYMGIYAGLAVASMLTTFSMGSIFAAMSVNASRSLHNASVMRVIRAPVSFFDTTPVGRILSRLTKDVETLDNILSDSMRMFVLMLSNTLGGVILIIIVEHYFAIAVVAIVFLYFFLYRFYAASAREVKRLDSILRSAVYGHFSESLAGLSTIRAFDRVEDFRKQNAHLIDDQDRAYILTTSNQRWVAVRLDTLSSILTLIVAFIAVAQRFKLSPAALGVSLVYILALQQGFSFIVRQFVMTEQNLNAAERLLHYSDELEQEPAHETAETRLSAAWPDKGTVSFEDVSMSYRPNLPLVLRGLTFSINAGESVGVVGRTGAGKSSIMQCLLRMIELSSGKITVDGVDISTIGLTDLRSRIGYIPQDSTLFEGSVRTNLDPFAMQSDLALNDALKGARLLDSQRTANFSLDTPVADGGLNLSVGERALVSLARALVRDTRIILLDEATASIDYETDAKIQETIVTEFSDRTLICIAHRLKTIIAYDRILVMSAGQVEEYDTPLNLFQKKGSFHAMCLSNSISEDDINNAKHARTNLVQNYTKNT